MRKTFKVFIGSIFFIFLINESLSAQRVVNVSKVCENWSREIHKIVSERELDSNLCVTVTFYEFGQKTKDITICWNKKKIKVDDVSFDLVAKKFVKNGKDFKIDNAFFSELKAIRTYVCRS